MDQKRTGELYEYGERKSIDCVLFSIKTVGIVLFNIYNYKYIFR